MAGQSPPMIGKNFKPQAFFIEGSPPGCPLNDFLNTVGPLDYVGIFLLGTSPLAWSALINSTSSGHMSAAATIADDIIEGLCIVRDLMTVRNNYDILVINRRMLLEQMRKAKNAYEEARRKGSRYFDNPTNLSKIQELEANIRRMETDLENMDQAILLCRACHDNKQLKHLQTMEATDEATATPKWC